MAKNVSRKAQALESHWTLATMVRDNWPAIVTTLGLSGLSGWVAWLGQAAANAAWHQELLFGIFGFSVTAFLVTGVWAFLSWVRRTKTQNAAISRNIAWSGYSYSPGDVIDGGTHTIADIFGHGRSRSRLTFRNAQIEGPGLVFFSGCQTEHCGFLASGMSVVIEPQSGALMSTGGHIFWHCRFENCMFVDAVCVGDLGFDPAQVAIFKLEQVIIPGAAIPAGAQGTEAEGNE